MMRRGLFASVGLVGVALYIPVASAQEKSHKWDSILPNTSISGEVLTSYEHYRSYGDDSVSPYRSTGGEAYSSQTLKLQHSVSEYESIQGRFSGLLNSSSYRSPFENEYIVEQFAASWEKGDGAIPFIAEVGDYYASFSSRSLQRPLKGARVELQPIADNWQHSIVGLSGYVDNDYRFFEPEEEYYYGASWLAEHERLGAFIFNAVHNEKNIEASLSAGTTSENHHQSVISLAMEQDFSILNQDLNVELETAYLDGNPNNTTTKQTDRSYSMSLDGQYNRIIQYGASFEQNGEHFSPVGGSVSADKRDFQADISFRFSQGTQVRFGGQWLENGFESADPTDIDTYDMKVIGTAFDQGEGGVNFSVNVQTRDSENESGSIDSRAHNAGLTLSKRLNPEWSIRGASQWRYNRNDVTNDTDTSRDVTVNLDRQINWAGWSGVVSPGVNLVGFNGQGDTDYTQFVPYFSTSLSKGAHSFNASYRFNYTNQDPSLDNVSEISQQTASARYNFDQGDYVLSVYGDSYDRTPDNAGNTHAYRFGLQLSYPFNRPARSERNKSEFAQYDVASNEQFFSDFDRLWNLGGQSHVDVVAMLESQNYNNIQKRSNKTIAQGLFLSQISLTQNMVYNFEDGKDLNAIALTFTPLENSSSALKREYQNVLDELIKTLGQPTAAYERGNFTSAVREDLAENRFKRIVEWSGDDGDYRFGLPHRLDGQLVFELQKRKRLSSHQNNMWSAAE